MLNANMLVAVQKVTYGLEELQLMWSLQTMVSPVSQPTSTNPYLRCQCERR